MNKKACISMAAVLAVMSVFAGSPVTAVAASEGESTGKFAIVTKSMGNPYNSAMAEGFRQVIEENGGTCIINHPRYANAEAQIPVIESLIEQDIDVLALASTEQERLSHVLEDAKAEGIKVITCDADADSSSRLTFCNQANESLIGETMMEAVYDIANGEGQFAILSAAARAANQNAWISSMKAVLEADAKYSELTLVDVAFGDDDADLSAEKTKELVEKYPDLKVICAVTSAGITAAAKALQEEKSDVKLTGIGMPSEMSGYVGEGNPCPYIYYWDPGELGMLAAYTAMAVNSGEITGEAGETFEAAGLKGSPFTITEIPGREPATEVLLGELNRFSGEEAAGS